MWFLQFLFFWIGLSRQHQVIYEGKKEKKVTVQPEPCKIVCSHMEEIKNFDFQKTPLSPFQSIGFSVLPSSQSAVFWVMKNFWNWKWKWCIVKHNIAMQSWKSQKHFFPPSPHSTSSTTRKGTGKKRKKEKKGLSLTKELGNAKRQMRGRAHIIDYGPKIAFF